MSERTHLGAVNDDNRDVVLSIYRCVRPETPWTQALDQVNREFGSRDAILRVATQGKGARHAMFAAGSTITPESIRMWENVSPHDLPLTGELEIDAGRIVVWREQAVPMARLFEQLTIGSTMMVCVDKVENAECVLHCNRSSSQPPFDAADLSRLRAIAPHFRNAMRIRRDLVDSEKERRVHALALDRLGIAALIIDARRRCTPQNLPARRLLKRSRFVLDAAGALHATDPAADAMLQKALNEALAASPLDARSLLFDAAPVAGACPVEHLHMAVCSWSTTSALFERPESGALVYVRDGQSVTMEDEQSLRRLFEFTSAEARVAILLMQYRGVREVAEALGISEATARTHLRAVHSKAGVSTRSELASLLYNSLLAFSRPDSGAK